MGWVFSTWTESEAFRPRVQYCFRADSPPDKSNTHSCESNTHSCESGESDSHTAVKMKISCFLDFNLHLTTICLVKSSKVGHHLGLINDYYKNLSWLKNVLLQINNYIKSTNDLLYALLGIGCNIHSVRAKVASIQFETNFTLSNNIPNNNLTIKEIASLNKRRLLQATCSSLAAEASSLLSLGNDRSSISSKRCSRPLT